MYKGLAIIFGFYFLGESISRFLSLPVPGNVLGMILLTIALLSGVIDLQDVEREAEFFVDNISIMFIPPGVGIILYFGLLKEEIVPIVGTLVLSFVITLVFVGKMVEALR